MRLEDQVCTLEQSVKLKELGVIQKSLFYFHPSFDRPQFGESKYANVQICNQKKITSSAYTAAELLVAHGDIRHFFENQSEAANKLARLLISDLLRGDITVSEVNERLRK